MIVDALQWAFGALSDRVIPAIPDFKPSLFSALALVTVIFAGLVVMIGGFAATLKWIVELIENWRKLSTFASELRTKIFGKTTDDETSVPVAQAKPTLVAIEPSEHERTITRLTKLIEKLIEAMNPDGDDDGPHKPGGAGALRKPKAKRETAAKPNLRVIIGGKIKDILVWINPAKHEPVDYDAALQSAEAFVRAYRADTRPLGEFNKDAFENNAHIPVLVDDVISALERRDFDIDDKNKKMAADALNLAYEEYCTSLWAFDAQDPKLTRFFTVPLDGVAMDIGVSSLKLDSPQILIDTSEGMASINLVAMGSSQAETSAKLIATMLVDDERNLLVAAHRKITRLFAAGVTDDRAAILNGAEAESFVYDALGGDTGGLTDDAQHDLDAKGRVAIPTPMRSLARDRELYEGFALLTSLLDKVEVPEPVVCN